MMKLFLVLFITGICLFPGCLCCPTEMEMANLNIPKELINKADNFITAKTGSDFFESYIRHNKQNTVKTSMGYLMVYNFSVPDKQGIEGEIRFNIDEDGNIIKDKEIFGIPDCSANPGDCMFSISAEQAVNIAKNNELNEGMRNWDVNFKWSSNHKKYVWEILSVLSEVKGEGFYRATGQTMLINPNTGEVIETSEWMIN